MKWLSTVSFIFLIIIIGYIIGKIKIFNISFGFSAILIISVVAGWIISKYIRFDLGANFENEMNFLSDFGIAMFVSSIGLSSGVELANGISKNNLSYFSIGAAMVLVGFSVMRIIGFFDSNIDDSILFGIFCGALTSTPGISSVCQTAEAIPELAVLGYGCTYIFGLVSAVIFAQVMKQNRSHEDIQSIDVPKYSDDIIKGLLPVSMSSFLGTAVGNIKLPIYDFSLGTTGGILCVSMVLGLLITKFGIKIIPQSTESYRNLGIIMFFVGLGTSTGLKLTRGIELHWFTYGILISLITIAFGYLFCRYIIGMSKISSSVIVAGGMTSTPAIGVLLKNNNDVVYLSSYSFSYIGALITIVIICALFI